DKSLLAKDPLERPPDGAVAARILAALARGEPIDVNRVLEERRDEGVKTAPEALDALEDGYAENEATAPELRRPSSTVEPPPGAGDKTVAQDRPRNNGSA